MLNMLTETFLKHSYMFSYHLEAYQSSLTLHKTTFTAAGPWSHLGEPTQRVMDLNSL